MLTLPVNKIGLHYTVNITFDDRDLAKRANDFRTLIRQYGEPRAKLIRRRLGELAAAVVLEDMRNLPAARCHELSGNRKGQLAVNLDHPYRLIFQPVAPPPLKADGGLDWNLVTSISILEITNYHD